MNQDISNIRNAATLGPLLFSSMHGGQTTGVDGEFGQAQPFGESSRSSNHPPCPQRAEDANEFTATFLLSNLPQVWQIQESRERESARSSERKENPSSLKSKLRHLCPLI